MRLAIVHWLAAAEQKIDPRLRPLFTRELAEIFAHNPQTDVYVHDCLEGFATEQARKVILAVEVKNKASTHMHIVKLGFADKVRADWEGWRKCVGTGRIGSPLFVSVTGVHLKKSKGRAAALYMDAHLNYGPDPKRDRPEHLEKAVEWAVLDDKPDLESVERVLTRIFSDLLIWFYAGSQADEARAHTFYHAKLDKALAPWSESSDRLALREDAIWLFCGRDQPDSLNPARYLDPLDYVRWALKERRIPPTLVGRSHGDLHGRNIFVGIRRGEAEAPVLIDYGDMDDANVIAWDFVKLEVELKTRLIDTLFRDPQERAALFPDGTALGGLKLLDRNGAAQAGKDGDTSSGILDKPLHNLFGKNRQSVSTRASRATRLAFVFEIEKLLTNGTRLIKGPQDAESKALPDGLVLPEKAKVSKLVRLLLRIRKEAALALGFAHKGRHLDWTDDYNFALAAYGLATAKYANYVDHWNEIALVSSGVAAAELHSARRVLREQMAGTARNSGAAPSYRVPLYHAHRRWIARDTKAASAILEKATKSFEHAVPLRQERGLLLADQNRLDDARTLLQPLAEMCVVFGDYETLSRIGRVLKNFGDREWQRNPCAFDDLHGLPASQFYFEACLHYLAAFQISHHYFPGVNAVTLAYLANQHDRLLDLAEKVLAICLHQQLSSVGKELYWVFASEAEASLVAAALDIGNARRIRSACGFYEAALRQVTPNEIGMVQATWNQLCRLWKALGASIVDPVVKVFASNKPIWTELDAGPLENCGRKKR
jgi:hypothetical protein